MRGRQLHVCVLLCILLVRFFFLEYQTRRCGSEVERSTVFLPGKVPEALSNQSKHIFRTHHSDEPPADRTFSTQRKPVVDNVQSGGGAAFHSLPPSIRQLVLECNSTKRMRIESKDFDGEDLRTRTERWVENAEFLADCSHSWEGFEPENISPVVHRIWECAEIPKGYTKGFESWLNNTHGKFFVLWTRRTRERYIERTLGTKRLNLYRRLVPGAFRADLFRYIVLYHVGGIYSDVDTTLHMNLEEVAHLSHGVTVAIDLDRSRLLNGAILITPPRNALFFCAMGEVFHHSERRTHFTSDLDISGPGVLGECLRHIMGTDDKDFSQDFVEELSKLGFHLLHSELLSGTHLVKLDDGNTLVSVEHGGSPYDRRVSEECDPGEHYSKLHSRREVYRGGGE